MQSTVIHFLAIQLLLEHKNLGIIRNMICSSCFACVKKRDSFLCVETSAVHFHLGQKLRARSNERLGLDLLQVRDVQAFCRKGQSCLGENAYGPTTQSDVT